MSKRATKGVPGTFQQPVFCSPSAQDFPADGILYPVARPAAWLQGGFRGQEFRIKADLHAAATLRNHPSASTSDVARATTDRFPDSPRGKRMRICFSLSLSLSLFASINSIRQPGTVHDSSRVMHMQSDCKILFSSTLCRVKKYHAFFFSIRLRFHVFACKQRPDTRPGECLTREWNARGISALARADGGGKKKFVYREGLIGGVEFFRRDSFASYRLGKIVSIDGTAISGHSTLFPRNSCENSFVIRRPAY